jgi:hypothetical protein
MKKRGSMKKSVLLLNNIKQASLGTEGKRPELYLALVNVSIKSLEG